MRQVPVVLTYSAPPACVDESGFRHRLPSLEALRTASPNAGTSIDVSIVERDGAYAGQVRVDHADGTATERAVASARCEDVTDALALIASVAVGLEYGPAPRFPPPPAAAARESERPGTGELATATPHRWQFTAAVGAALLDGVAPDVRLAPNGTVGMALGGAGLFAPTIELSVIWTEGEAVATSAGSANLAYRAGALAACPVRVPLLGGLALRPCAEVSAGELSAAPIGPNVAQTGVRVEPSVAIAALGRVEWLSGHVFTVEVEAGPRVELYRDRFYFEPAGTQLYLTPRVGGLAGLATGIRWP